MRILFLTYQGKIAGSTLSISYLVGELSRRGHEIVVGCRPNNLLSDLLRESGATVYPIRFKGRFDRQSMRDIRTIVERHRIQLINAQSTHDRYCSVLARWLYRLPVRLVHTRRQMPRSAGGYLQSRFYERGTDRIVAVSNGVKYALMRRGISGRHITVIHNGTPPAKYQHLDHNRSEALRGRFGIRNGDVVVGCIARRKNQDQLLRAMQFVDVPSKVLLVGVRADRQLLRLAESVSLRHDVRFCGLVQPRDALSYYPLFSAFVLPSIMEGLSQALLEAMALGVPVIATRAGGNPDLIVDGRNGYLFNDGDVRTLAERITQVVTRPAATVRMVANARRTALEQFTLERTADGYERLFAELVGEQAPAGQQKSSATAPASTDTTTNVRLLDSHSAALT